MKRRNVIITVGLFVAFALWTMLIKNIDVQSIGPRGSSVGFATINRTFHEMTGVHMVIYSITDWLGLIPLFCVMGFAILGLVQWMRRKRLRKVDKDIFILGGFYILVMGVYLFFEFYVVNYRPILLDGFLEASYPSSTTMLVMCVMPTTMMQIKKRIRNKKLRYAIQGAILVFSLFMVIGRLFSGVHWLTDIIGGVIISSGLVFLYYSMICVLKKI